MAKEGQGYPCCQHDMMMMMIWVRDTDLTVIQANGRKMELNSMVHLPIKVGGIKTWSKLYIAPG